MLMKIIATKIETRNGGMKTAYYKYMGANGKPTLGGKRDAATFDATTAAKVLEQLKTIDGRFTAGGEVVDF